jgi:hypothetical protein
MDKHKIGSIIFLIGGLALLLIPTRVLVSDDLSRNFGPILYKAVLELTGSEKKALFSAALFYKLFGLCFVIIGIIRFN